MSSPEPPKQTFAGGSAAETRWQHGWAYCYFDTAGLTLEQSPDNGSSWAAAQRMDGGAATSSNKEFMHVMLIPGLRTRAQGTGNVICWAGSAGTYGQPKAISS